MLLVMVYMKGDTDCFAVLMFKERWQILWDAGYGFMDEQGDRAIELVHVNL